MQLPRHARFRRLLGGSVLAIAVAACSPAGSATPSPSDAPAAFGLRTAAVQPQACMDALMGGRLTRHAQSGLGITAADGTQTPVEWPFRYSAWLVDGPVVLHDETGKTVAREGDEVTVGGGLGNALWYACAPVSVTRPAS
jgi:hypothetical protein